MQIKDFFYPLFLILLIGGAILFFYSHYNYVDVIGLCSISIEADEFHGDRSTIFQAMDEIKKNHSDKYNDICQNVKTISENLCPIYHTYGGPWQYNNQPGCFIKGSKIIYITPTKDTSENTIKDRASAILRYGQMSKTYNDENP
jgi:hypothetical protein